MSCNVIIWHTFIYAMCMECISVALTTCIKHGMLVCLKCYKRTQENSFVYLHRVRRFILCLCTYSHTTALSVKEYYSHRGVQVNKATC